jgi:type II restriction/modification system DNA methylase subunit YeeA
MRAKYPNIYSYFHCFFNDLINRGGEPYKSKLEPYRDKPLKIAEEIAPPFYWVFNVKPSLTPYKVVWKRIAGAITGKAISFVCAVTEPINGKPVIPDDGTILIATETQDEAYYVAGILNSIIVRTIIASYTYELRQETHIADVIKIPKFDPKNETHKKIADLSKRAHMFAKCIYAEEKPEYCIGINAETELKNVESELDKAVAQLFELSPDRIKEFEMLMSILSGEEQSTEEDAEAPEEPIVTIPNTLLLPNTQSYIDIEVVNPSGKEIEFYYELPWDKGYFRLTDGTYKLQIPPLNEGKYKGLLRYSWHGSEKIINIQIEVSKNVGPKRSRRM